MKRRNISEPEAYRWLRCRAMNAGRLIVEIAGEVLDDAGQ
jgi:AmiR/NasT family two-component response regulator